MIAVNDSTPNIPRSLTVTFRPTIPFRNLFPLSFGGELLGNRGDLLDAQFIGLADDGQIKPFVGSQREPDVNIPATQRVAFQLRGQIRVADQRSSRSKDN